MHYEKIITRSWWSLCGEVEHIVYGGKVIRRGWLLDGSIANSVLSIGKSTQFLIQLRVIRGELVIRESEFDSIRCLIHLIFY